MWEAGVATGSGTAPPRTRTNSEHGPRCQIRDRCSPQPAPKERVLQTEESRKLRHQHTALNLKSRNVINGGRSGVSAFVGSSMRSWTRLLYSMHFRDELYQPIRQIRSLCGDAFGDISSGGHPAVGEFDEVGKTCRANRLASYRMFNTVIRLSFADFR